MRMRFGEGRSALEMTIHQGVVAYNALRLRERSSEMPRCKRMLGLRTALRRSTALALLAVSSNCSGGGDAGPKLSGEQLDAIAEAFAFSAKSAVGMDMTASSSAFLSSPDGALLAYRKYPVARSKAQRLIPPYSCPSGGDIYFTSNVDFTDLSGCCGNDPPCSQDSLSAAGQSDIIYNSCAVHGQGGDSVVVSGSLKVDVIVNAIVYCPSTVTVGVTVTLTGMPRIGVNGKDVCKGDIFLTVRGYSESSIWTSISGTVCGQHIYKTFEYGCAVTCADNSCCAVGEECSTNCPTTSCVPAGGVDCCNGKYCEPPYTACMTAQDKCALP
jgi:hypothetical protein